MLRAGPGGSPGPALPRRRGDGRYRVGVSVQPSPARTVGDYTLLARLGEGGMGVVHLARKPDGPRVALKVLRPHIVGDDEARARLAREVSSLERIRSRWIAEIVDADPWGPTPYVATRYVPGLSLARPRARGGPDPRATTSAGSPPASPRAWRACTRSACCTAT